MSEKSCCTAYPVCEECLERGARRLYEMYVGPWIPERNTFKASRERFMGEASKVLEAVYNHSTRTEGGGR